MTTYLPILSGIFAPGLAGGMVLEAGNDMSAACKRTARQDKVSHRRMTVMHASGARPRARAAHGRAPRAVQRDSAEVLITGMRELHHSPFAQHLCADCRAQRAE